MKCLALASVAVGACIFTGPRSSYTAVPKAAPAIASTAGDDLLKFVPAGAQVVIEIDLARLYANPTIGDAAKRAIASPDPSLLLPRVDAPLASAKMIVMAAYDVGTADATTATIVATRGEVPNGVAIADGVIALAPPPMIERIRAHGPSIASDQGFMALRARAMPDGAPGATVRMTARLDLDARIALAPVLGPDLAPASLSLWADVVDDAAMVAILDGHDAEAGGGSRLYAALERTRIAIAGSTSLIHLGLVPTLREATFTRAGEVVKVVATIGPKRLRALADALYPRSP